MLESEVSKIVSDGARSLGFALPQGATKIYSAYFDFLAERGEKTNLTAITGVEDVARLHFLDSIALLNVVNFYGASLIDIGSGAGFPGLPLKIAVPSISLTLLDSAGKRAAFLAELSDALGIEAKILCSRAEEASHLAEHREMYDIAVSRAVARLNVLCELCLPLVRPGGMFVAMKGTDSADEISEASSAIEILGGTLHNVYDYEIPVSGVRHRAVIIKKISNTPKDFPRRFAKIKKSAL